MENFCLPKQVDGMCTLTHEVLFDALVSPGRRWKSSREEPDLISLREYIAGHIEIDEYTMDKL